MDNTFSRRTFLRYTAVASAVGIPISAEARDPKGPPLSDQQQLDACIDQLKNILQRMHPSAEPASHYIRRDDDGGFYVTMRAKPAYQEFDGDGFYLVSMDGYPVPYWLQENYRITRSGKVLDRHFLSYQWVDDDLRGGGRYFAEARYCGAPNIIRKLEMPEGMTREDVPFQAPPRINEAEQE